MTTHPPSYTNDALTVSLPAPPYVAVSSSSSSYKSTPFPTASSQCTLSMRNVDKPESDITIHDLDAGDKVVFTVHVAGHAAGHANLLEVEDKLSSAVRDKEAGYSLTAFLNVAVDGSVPYLLRKQDSSSVFEVVSLSPAFSLSPPSSVSSVISSPHLGEVRKLTTKTTLFKTTKHTFAGVGGRECAWKGNVNRTLFLYEYPSSSTSNTGSTVNSGSSTPSSSSSSKTLLSEFNRNTNGASIFFNTSNISTALDVVASLLPLLFSHRSYISTHYTTDADLDRLQNQVRPSNWDAFFLSGGKGTEKQEKFKNQMTKERERKERSESRNRNEVQGVIPALPDRRSLRSRYVEDDSKADSSADEDDDEDKRG